MRKYCVILAILVTLIGYGYAQAGLISILSAHNTGNDDLQDQSRGFVMDVKGPEQFGVGDVAWGLMFIDKVNGQNQDYTVWLVYSAKVKDVAGSSTYTFEPVQSNYDYSLAGLLGNQISDNALFVLLETPSRVEFKDNDYGSPSALKQAIQTKFFPSDPNAQAQLIAAFGLGTGDTGDQYIWQKVTEISYLQSGEFSVLQSFVGDKTNWRNLWPSDELPSSSTDNQAAFGYGATVNILGGRQVSDDEAYWKIKDSGTFHVNYVPEPGSMIGLASLALAGAGLGFLRRRKA